MVDKLPSEILLEAPPNSAAPILSNGKPAFAAVTNRFKQPIVTHRFWTSIIWHGDDNFSTNLIPAPWLLKCNNTGFVCGYSDSATISPYGINTQEKTRTREYHLDLCFDIYINFSNTSAQQTAVNSYTDSGVNFSWLDSQNNSLADCSLTQGVCQFWLNNIQQSTTITFQNLPTIMQHSTEGDLLIKLNGRFYGIHSGGGLNINQNDPNNLIITFTPQECNNWLCFTAFVENSTNLFNDFVKAARQPILGTRIDYNWNNTQLQTSYNYFSDEKCTQKVDAPHYICVKPHIWKYLADTSIIQNGCDYFSPHGPMKLVKLNNGQFSTNINFWGLWPENCLPIPTSITDTEKQELQNLLNNFMNQDENTRWNYINCSSGYWYGKQLQRIANITCIADQLGNTAARDKLLDELQTKLLCWWSSSPPCTAFNREWCTLIQFPDSYGSAEELNDHVFHYGYFVAAANCIAKYKPSFINDHGDKITTLIADFYNWDRNSTLFPYTRSHEHFSGNDIANGRCFWNGNNLESSSESINAAAAAAIWGKLSNNSALRDLALSIYVHNIINVEEYWFDIQKTNYPQEYNQDPQKCILWVHDGSALATFWSSTPQEQMGINYLPIAAHSLYLTRYPSYLQTVQNWLENYQYTDGTKQIPDHLPSNGGRFKVWNDIMLQIKAIYDNDGSFGEYEKCKSNWIAEAGDSQIKTYHWLLCMKYYGNLQNNTNSVWSLNFTKYGLLQTEKPINNQQQSVTFNTDGTIDVIFKQKDAQWADLHYKFDEKPEFPQQNIRMQKNDSKFSYKIYATGVNKISYSFTYFTTYGTDTSWFEAKNTQWFEAVNTS